MELKLHEQSVAIRDPMESSSRKQFPHLRGLAKWGREIAKLCHALRGRRTRACLPKLPAAMFPLQSHTHWCTGTYAAWLYRPPHCNESAILGEVSYKCGLRFPDLWVVTVPRTVETIDLGSILVP